jgi:hypothetical protein
LGIEFTKININQLKVVKQGENPAISLFNAFVKSDAGSQIIGQVGSGLKAYLDANSANQQTENNLVMQNGNVDLL